MKTIAYKVRAIDRIPYPNAATGRELLHKALDTALVTASGIGIGAIIALMTVI